MRRRTRAARVSQDTIIIMTIIIMDVIFRRTQTVKTRRFCTGLRRWLLSFPRHSPDCDHNDFVTLILPSPRSSVPVTRGVIIVVHTASLRCNNMHDDNTMHRINEDCLHSNDFHMGSVTFLFVEKRSMYRLNFSTHSTKTPRKIKNSRH